MKVLCLTSEWPTGENPNHVPFLVDHILSLEKFGIKSKVLKVSPSSISSYLQSISQIRETIKTDSYDLIHTHWGWNGLMGIWFNKPHIMTFHGSDLNPPISWSIRNCIIYIISQWSVSHNNYNIFVSNTLGKQSIMKSINNSEVIPMGTDLRKFKPMNKIETRHKLQLPVDKKLILFGGNKSQPIKRLSLAEFAVSNLGDKYKLITVDYEDHKKMPLYMNAVDVLLMTSKSEGSPMMIKEALACNLPIISTDVGDVRKMIHGLENCHLILNEKPEHIAELIKKCVSNPIRPLGRERMKKYSLDRVATRITHLYKKVSKNHT